MHCVKCGVPLYFGDQKCPICGTSVSNGSIFLEKNREDHTMFCTQCGAPLSVGDRQCSSCGKAVNTNPRPVYREPYVNNLYFNMESLPQQYRPLGAWAYFGYTLLFSIPFVGFILLLVLSFNDSNINRRNFARSYWCVLVVMLILIVILMSSGLLIVGR